jgi:hypothetical protein
MARQVIRQHLSAASGVCKNTGARDRDRQFASANEVGNTGARDRKSAGASEVGNTGARDKKSAGAKDVNNTGARDRDRSRQSRSRSRSRRESRSKSRGGAGDNKSTTKRDHQKDHSSSHQEVPPRRIKRDNFVTSQATTAKQPPSVSDSSDLRHGRSVMPPDHHERHSRDVKAVVGGSRPEAGRGDVDRKLVAMAASGGNPPTAIQR